MGADCITNNLHFHLVSVDNLFGDMNSLTGFPIENCPKKLFFKTSLKHNSSDEVEMYNCGVRFGEVLNWPLHTLVLNIISNNN